MYSFFIKIRVSYFKTQLALAIIVYAFVCSCSNPVIYQTDRKWSFEIDYSFSEKNDTLTLETTDESWSIYQKKSKWTTNLWNTGDSVTRKLIIEQTGIVERNYPAIFNWIYSSQVWIHPPRYKPYLHLTEMVPFPWIKYPIEIGQKNDWELTPKSGWEELEGKTVTGNLSVNDRIYYDNPVIKDSVWVIDAIGKSEVGIYKAKYYFHEKFGFIYFYYDFNDYQIEISPFDISFVKPKIKD